MAVRCASAAFACLLISTADLAMLAMPYVLCTPLQHSMGRSRDIHEVAVSRQEWEGCWGGRGGAEASHSQTEGDTDRAHMQGQGGEGECQGQGRIGAKVS